MIAFPFRTSAAMARTKPSTSIHLRVMPAPGVALGPGKRDLLAGIRETGSIAAAGRRMRMSYRRAWQLVEELNRGFRGPLVEASKGGSGGGGARLTRLGDTVLDRYERMRAAANAAVATDLAALRRLVARDD
ncbi:molybdate transport system regulatory protein [Dokdonella fugitiva]|jgi:molybdate transport system regulatory protein|uniref:Molybdate transport system regulatory protein n=2 Tax=Dokdonella fugitiva TaxID=328517 RepID=A0A4V2S2U3_9GAMM|nr:molybdate transport system regulatory protein [Dokdonella fugitiva]